MQPKRILLIAYLFFCVATLLKAQSSTSSYASPSNSPKAKDNDERHRNLIKINLTAIALKNYSVQYERVLNKSVSLAISYRKMPSTTIPFKNLILKSIGDDEADTREVLETFKLSNSAITPEVRFYVGKKGYGQGFYIAPFYRYAGFETNSLIFDFSNSANVESSITLSGKLTANTGGLMFGAQWALGKHLCLDWWILGPHYGAGKGTFAGVSSKALTQAEQEDLRVELEDLDIPLTDKTVIVNANGASVKLDGPFAGVRAGISIGFTF